MLGRRAGYSWVYVNKKMPALKVWDKTHPLVKGLPKVIEQTAFINPAYMYRPNDGEAWSAARNGDGYTNLLSKSFGTNGGVFVYVNPTPPYATPPHSRNLDQILIKCANGHP